MKLRSVRSTEQEFKTCSIVINYLFDDNTIAALMELKWWDLPEDELRDLLPDLVYGRLDKVLARKQISDTVREVLSKYFPKLNIF